jgi:hypothetical protein
LGTTGADVVAIVALGGVTGPLDEHGRPTAPAAREAHQQVLRRQPPGWGLPPRSELLLDRLEKIFPHERFMGSRSFLATPKPPEIVGSRRIQVPARPRGGLTLYRVTVVLRTMKLIPLIH